MKARQLGSLYYNQFVKMIAVNACALPAMVEAFQDCVASHHKKTVSMTSRSGVTSLPGCRGAYMDRASS
jgi:hypothetical protein